jgi:hypothetical protein
MYASLQFYIFPAPKLSGNGASYIHTYSLRSYRFAVCGDFPLRECQTPVQWSAGTKPEIKRGDYMITYNILKETIQPDPGQAVKEIFFTQKGNSIYAIVPKWPGKTLVINNFDVTRHLSLVIF